MNDETNRPAAPEPRGTLLATIDRGADEQLRVSIDEFKGFQYISIRAWSRGHDGTSWWPIKGKGVTIKLREIADVGKALRAAYEQTATARAEAEQRAAERRAAGPGSESTAEKPAWLKRRHDQMDRENGTPRGGR